MFTKFKEITFYPGMAKIYTLQFFLAFSEFFMVVFFPLLLDSKGYSKGTLGSIIFGATFVLLWLKPSLGGVSDRFGYRIPVLFVLSSLACLYFLATVINNIYLFIAFYFIVYVLIFIGYPAINSGTANISSPKQRGLALGTLGVYTSFGRSSSTAVMSPVWEIFNITNTFMIAGVMIFIFVIILFFITKTNEEQSEKV